MEKFKHLLTSYATVLLSTVVLLGTASCSDSNDDNKTPGGGDNIVATSITVSPTSASLEVGATQLLTVTVLPADATNKNYTLESSNSAIATIKDNTVTAVGVGTATITAKLGSLTPATCQISVTEKTTGDDGVPPTSVTIPNVEFGTVTLSNPAPNTMEMAIVPNDKTMTYIYFTMSKEDYDEYATPEELILDDLNYIKMEAAEYEETYLGNLAYYITTDDFDVILEELDPGTTYVLYAYGMSEDGKTVLSKIATSTLATTGTAPASAKSLTKTNMGRFSAAHKLSSIKPVRVVK